MNKVDCLFCKIVKKEIPSKILYENEHTLAFLDIFPIAEGHSIIIPKNHHENLEMIPHHELNETIRTTKLMAKKIRKRLNIDGYNILQNNFKAAGQEIEHFHIHIIPRSIDDNKFKLKIPREQANDSELEKLKDKILS